MLGKHLGMQGISLGFAPMIRKPPATPTKNNATRTQNQTQTQIQSLVLPMIHPVTINQKN